MYLMNVQLIFYVMNGDLMWHTKATPYHTISNSQHVHSHAKHIHPSPTIISLWPIQRLINTIISPYVKWTCKNLYPGVASDDFHDFDDLSLSHPSAANHHKEVGSNWESYVQGQAAV